MTVVSYGLPPKCYHFMPYSVGEPPVIVGQPDCYTWLPGGQSPFNQIKVYVFYVPDIFVCQDLVSCYFYFVLLLLGPELLMLYPCMYVLLC